MSNSESTGVRAPTAGVGAQGGIVARRGHGGVAGLAALPAGATRALVAVLCTLGAWLALAAAPALAVIEHPFKFELSSSNTPSQANLGGEPSGAAVDANGDLYTSILLSNVVDVFDPSGNYLTQIADSNLSNPLAVAVNSSGDVYVQNFSGSVVEYSPSSFPVTSATTYTFQSVLDPGPASGVAVDSSNNVYVDRGSEVIEHEPSSATKTIGSGVLSSGEGLAVNNATGDVYVADSGYEAVLIFHTDGTYAYFSGSATPSGSFSGLTAVAVDQASGHVYVVDAGDNVVDEFDATGSNYIDQIAGTPTHSFHLLATADVTGVAVDNSGGPAAGSVYVPDTNDGVLDAFGPLVTLPDVTTGTATNLAPTSVTLNGHVDPAGGGGVTDCHFEYGTDASYGNTAPCLDASNTIVGTPANPITAPVDVHADVTGLQPNATYHYRLDAGNANGTNHGLDQTFTTPSPPTIDSESATAVTADSATLEAQINPIGADTTYHFEYGTTTNYGTSVPVPDADIGSGSSDTSVNQHVQGLLASTTYHFRVIAHNGFGTVTGPDRSFTTQPPGTGSFTLPDGRAYELVSPPDMNNGDVGGGGSTGDEVAAPGGGAIDYEVAAGFGDVQGFGTTANYLSTRSADSWATTSTEPLQAPHESFTSYYMPMVLAMSDDLSKEIVLTNADPSTGEALPGGAQALYLRDNTTGAYRSIEQIPADTSNTITTVTIDARTPDLADAVIDISENRGVNNPTTTSTLTRYDAASGQLTDVSVLPDGTQASGPSMNKGAGVFRQNYHYLSDNGNIVFFATVPDAFGPVYRRDVAAGQTVELSPNAIFNGASADGQRALLRVSLNSGGVSDLYMYDAAAPPGQRLTALTTDGTFDGVLGMTADARRVYFVDGSQLVPGSPAQTGAPNVYLWDDSSGTPQLKYVATLNSSDRTLWGSGGAGETRVSADGRYLAFLSRTSGITGDATAGFVQAYEYDAGGSTPTRPDVLCASCVPGQASTADVEFHQGRVFVNVGVHFPRNLADDGRVFFETTQALVPQDTNARMNVYQYEPVGVGDCAQSGGCVSLISTGRSSYDSYFADASTSGDDVYFFTRESLVGIDTNDHVNLYDARVGGGLASQNPPAPAPPCTGADSCRGAPATQPPPTAASVTFTGPGNLSPAAPATTAKVKVLTGVVHGSTFLLIVKVPGMGRITITGAGIRTVRRSVGRAGTYRLRVSLTAKERKALQRKHKLKLRVRVGYVPAGGAASAATVTVTVKPALRHRARHARRARQAANTTRRAGK